MLTDPVIMSMDKKYGVTDTGIEEIYLFFHHHTCTSFCKSLDLFMPPKAVLRNLVPQEVLKRCEEKANELNEISAYDVDLEWNEETRTEVAQKLRMMTLAENFRSLFKHH